MWGAWIAIIVGVLTALVLASYASRHPEKPDA